MAQTPTRAPVSPLRLGEGPSGTHSRHGSTTEGAEPAVSPMYSGNPVRMRLQPVLGDVRPVPDELRDTSPSQLLQPFRTEVTGSMLPIHANYSHAEVMYWHKLQEQIAHRYYKPIKRPDHDAEREDEHVAPRPQVESVSEAPDVPHQGMHDTVGWAAVAAREGRIDVHPQDTEAKAALTMHLSSQDAWNQPWQFDETIGAGSAQPIIPIAGLSEEKTANLTRVQRRRYRVRMFMLRNVFVPLLCRALNVGVLSATLGIGVRLRKQLVNNDAEMSVGVSPLAAIIFSPPSIVYALTQIWIEYRSRPIGLWKLSSKLWYTALELVFICLWSAELSLSMDNYFTSNVVCVSPKSPFYSHASRFGVTLTHPDAKGTICDLQIALICVVFISVVVYLFVFMVRATLTQISLFRIFHRIRL